MAQKKRSSSSRTKARRPKPTPQSDHMPKSSKARTAHPLLFLPPNVKPPKTEKMTLRLGWMPDLPDFRDRTLTHNKVHSALSYAKSSLVAKAPPVLPPKVDNREHCSPIEDQLSLGSCTAQAVVGMMEYLMKRSGIAHVNASRLFLYKVTRKLLGWEGDTGAYIRSTIQAAATFGMPPEKHWPYIISRYEDEPEAFHYSYAANFKSLNYARLDEVGSTAEETLKRIKQTLYSGFSIAFGFSVFSSMSMAADIPYPTPQDSLEGGHAVLAVGFDDEHEVDGVVVPSLIIRNSWGTAWGEGGYGYLPYRYVTDELADDFWAIFKQDWINPEQFR